MRSCAAHDQKSLGRYPWQVAVTQANYGQFLLQQGDINRGVAMLWEAYEALRRAGYSRDVQAMHEVLVTAKSQMLGVERFDQAWAETQGQPQPNWLTD